jgi:hypothetical protein
VFLVCFACGGDATDPDRFVGTYSITTTTTVAIAGSNETTTAMDTLSIALGTSSDLVLGGDPCSWAANLDGEDGFIIAQTSCTIDLGDGGSTITVDGTGSGTLSGSRLEIDLSGSALYKDKSGFMASGTFAMDVDGTRL